MDSCNDRRTVRLLVIGIGVLSGMLASSARAEEDWVGDSAASPDVAVVLASSSDPGRTQVIFTASVRNDGPGSATAVVLNGVISDVNVAPISVTTTRGSCTTSELAPGVSYRCALDDLALGENATVTIAVRPMTHAVSVQLSVDAFGVELEDYERNNFEFAFANVPGASGSSFRGSQTYFMDLTDDPCLSEPIAFLVDLQLQGVSVSHIHSSRFASMQKVGGHGNGRSHWHDLHVARGLARVQSLFGLWTARGLHADADEEDHRAGLCDGRLHARERSCHH
jgi:hypothetical protein